MFKFRLIFAVFLASGASVRSLNPQNKKLHQEVDRRLREMGQVAHANFSNIIKELDVYRTELVKNIIYDASQNYQKVDRFQQEYVAIITGAAANSPVKLQKRAASAPKPGGCEIDPMADVWHRGQNTNRIITQCVLKYLKSADKAINEVHNAEREFVHKLYDIEVRLEQCNTHHGKLPGGDDLATNCIQKVDVASQELANKVLPQVWEHFQVVEDFYHHDETNVQHCAKEAGIDYFEMRERPELHQHMQLCHHL
ncbi:uncharacterized protein [Fopius arisanus]|uniref:Uncharacterized protein n=1 Tax=Fopius arisanus TaxID=64838 RepID=A0A9R1U349_9HYME|nr:PREDICTED: uncharacterized protein LOC105268998 [Fopius arisanus]